MNSHNKMDDNDSEFSHTASEMDDNDSEFSHTASEMDDNDSEMDKMEWRNSPNQQLLKSLRESIVDKPPYISGTLPLPPSCFTLFYKDGPVARFAGD